MLTQQTLRKLFPPLNGFLIRADDTVDMSASARPLLPCAPTRSPASRT